MSSKKFHILLKNQEKILNNLNNQEKVNQSQQKKEKQQGTGLKWSRIESIVTAANCFLCVAILILLGIIIGDILGGQSLNLKLIDLYFIEAIFDLIIFIEEGIFISLILKGNYAEHRVRKVILLITCLALVLLSSAIKYALGDSTGSLIDCF